MSPLVKLSVLYLCMYACLSDAFITPPAYEPADAGEDRSQPVQAE